MGTSDFMTQVLGLHHFQSKYFGIWQPVTHMFVHASFNHLLFNMLGLIVFAPMLEVVWGAKRFLIFYFVCGIGAGLLYSTWNYIELAPQLTAYNDFLANPTPGAAEQFILKFHKGLAGTFSGFFQGFEAAPNDASYIAQAKLYFENLVGSSLNRPMVGASGALYGVLAAFGLLFPNTELVLLFPPIPVKAKYMIGFYALLALYGVYDNSPSDSTAHFAHIGGMIFGAVMVFIWRRDRRNFY